MAEEQPKDPRSIDERLDAITMNLELQIRETEALRAVDAELRAADAELRANDAELRANDAELRASQADLRASNTEFRESLADFRATILPAIENLLQSALAQERRLCDRWKIASPESACYHGV